MTTILLQIVELAVLTLGKEATKLATGSGLHHRLLCIWINPAVGDRASLCSCCPSAVVVI